MIVTIVAIISDSVENVNDEKNPQAILSQVESNNVKELETFCNSIAKFCTEFTDKEE